MGRFRFNGKILALLIIACSIFNYIIRWDSSVGFFSLVITFFFIAVMINYIVFKLQTKNPDKVSKWGLIIYAALSGSTGIIKYIINAFQIEIPSISWKVLSLITSPYSGLCFVLRFENLENVASLIFGIIFISLVFYLTTDDMDFREMLDGDNEDNNEDNKEENKEDNEINE